MWSEDKTHQDTQETLCHPVSSSSVSVSDFETNEMETVVRYRRGGLRVGEVWFGDRKPTRCDILKYIQAPRKPTSVQAVRFTTLCIDVTQPPERVLSSFSPETRKAVRRAEARDGFVHEFDLHPDGRLITEFKTFYSEFCRLKGLPIGRLWHLDALAQQGALTLSIARAASGNALVWQSYLISGNRARALQGGSLFRNFAGSSDRDMMGRANRWLHWRDMCALKEAGVVTYDLGGWYSGHNDQEKLRINRFKEGFGGTLTVGYSWIQGNSLIGKLAVWLHHFRTSVP